MPTGMCTICTRTHTPKTHLRSENLLPLGPLSACTQHGIGSALQRNSGPFIFTARHHCSRSSLMPTPLTTSKQPWRTCWR